MTRRLAVLAVCNLNQWSLDFEGNIARIKKSIQQAKARGATYRVGPELEIPGYGCEDHFSELDTVDHSWECVTQLVEEGYTDGIVCDVGLPVMHRGVRYNCRLFILNRKVLLIRPKMHLANDGNYREPRHFAAWKHPHELQEHSLPPAMQAACGGQVTCPFGDGILRLNDALLAAETCEELFTPRAPHIDLALAGVEIISNGSASHHQLRKLDLRLDLIRSATAKAGGVYLYSNQRGCDGGRLYYDGCCSVVVNGQVVGQGGQFGVEEVEVVTATVDLDEVVSYRGAISSLREQASHASSPPIVCVDFSLCSSTALLASPPAPPKVHCVEEEIAYGPACWLWDYLRRSAATGYLLPLSGGADSSSTAAIVGAMCQLVIKALEAGDEVTKADVQRITAWKSGEPLPSTPQELADHLFVTMYQGTVNSSADTRSRSKELARQVGAYHLDIKIDSVVEALVSLFVTVTGKRPAFRVDGGTPAENLAMQNIQARLRMVISFLFAQLVPWVRGRSGFLLVLGSANVDECLRGYLTKYDCSSADVNPIGGISKQDLRRFLRWGAQHLGYPALAEVESAPPTAELEPLRDGVKPQNDEDDMGMSYAELSVYGRLRKITRCGPVSMFVQCLQLWRDHLSPAQVAAKVKRFFFFYSANRHKATVLTPSYHAESYSPDDNRFDHRQFLYNTRWPWQFRRIDEMATKLSGACEGADGGIGGPAGTVAGDTASASLTVG